MITILEQGGVPEIHKQPTFGQKGEAPGEPGVFSDETAHDRGRRAAGASRGEHHPHASTGGDGVANFHFLFFFDFSSPRKDTPQRPLEKEFSGLGLKVG